MSDEDDKKVEWIYEQVVEFKKNYEHYKLASHYLDLILNQITKQVISNPLIQVRTKSLSSFAEKIERKNYSGPLEQMTDLCGARLVASTIEDKEKLCKLVEKYFEVDPEKSVDASERLRPNEFGYRSVHYIVSFNPEKLSSLDISLTESELASIDGIKAEIQVRTRMEHSYADFYHRYAYKAKHTIPPVWQHDLASLAAMLERVDSSFLRIKKGIEAYSSRYSNYMEPAEIDKEIKIMKSILPHSEGQEKLDIIYRIGRLYLSISNWDGVIQVHQEQKEKEGLEDIRSDCEDIKYLFALRDLGIATCKKSADNISYRKGLKYLEFVVEKLPEDLLSIVSYAEALEMSLHTNPENMKKIGKLYSKAFEIDPSDYYTLVKYIIYEASIKKELSFIKHLKPSIKEAIIRAEEHIELNMNLPQAYYYLGKLYYFNGELNNALLSFASGIRLQEETETLKEEIRVINLIFSASNQPTGKDMIRNNEGDSLGINCLRNILQLFIDINTETMKKMSEDEPIVIVSGNCNRGSEGLVDKYKETILNSFKNFKGTIISGGTCSGVSGLVGDMNDPDIHTWGYLPETRDYLADSRYNKLVKTEGHDFSALEPLTYWRDLIDKGILPSRVLVLGIGGGRVSSIECRIALSLGATVAILDEGNDECFISEIRKLQNDSSLRGMIIYLPKDEWTISKLLNYIRQGKDSSRSYLKMRLDDIEKMAEEFHKEHVDGALKNALKNLKEQDIALNSWEDLPDYFKDSNRLLARDIETKLSECGFSIRKVEDGTDVPLFEFTPEEIEMFAVMEHGRWNAERLLDGWIFGPKDSEKKISPYLVPWEELPEYIKDYDRDPVKAIPEKLAKYGYEIYRNV